MTVDQHTGDVANYLFADAHVEAVPAAQISEWCAAGENFARPPQ